MKMYEIINNFHGTTARTKYSPEAREKIEIMRAEGKALAAEIAAMNRSRNKLCGVSDCCCGNGWGERK